MNFYLNVSPLVVGEYSGVENYVFFLTEAAIQHYPQHTFHLHFGVPGWNPKIDTLAEYANVRIHRHQGGIRSYAALPLELIRTRSSCYALLNGDGSLRIPVPKPTAGLVFDTGLLTHPGDRTMTPEAWSEHLRRRDIVLTISEAVKAELVALTGMPPERIVNTRVGVRPPDPSEETERPGALPAGARYFLQVNPGRPYKNWQDTFAAFTRFLEQGSEQERETLLVLAGNLRTEVEPIAAALAANPLLASRTLTLGFVSNAELAYLYRNARLCLMPSSMEGFGIPVIEAMVYDLPVIASSIPVLVEVAGGAALHFALGDVEAYCEAMQRFDRDEALRASMVDAGRRNAEKYTWERAARSMVEALEKLGRR